MIRQPSSEKNRTPERPTPELLTRLRKGKERVHEEHATLDLPRKVEQVLELQRLYLILLERQRPLRSWERPWDVSPGGSAAPRGSQGSV